MAHPQVQCTDDETILVRCTEGQGSYTEWILPFANHISKSALHSLSLNHRLLVTKCNALLVAWFTVSTSDLIVNWLIPKCIAPKAKLNRIDSVSICPSMDFNPWWVEEHIYLRVRYCWDQVTRCNALLITWFAVSTSGLIVYWFIPKCIAPTKKVTDSFQPATSFKPNIPNWEFSKKSYDLWAIS